MIVRRLGFKIVGNETGSCAANMLAYTSFSLKSMWVAVGAVFLLVNAHTMSQSMRNRATFQASDKFALTKHSFEAFGL